MKGWPNESGRHALAARGIKTRGVYNPMTKRRIKTPKKIYRHVKDLYTLSEVLKTGKISDIGYGKMYGGLTTQEGFYGLFGEVMIEFKGDILAKDNDIFPVVYKKEFFKKYPKARHMVRGKSDFDGPLEGLEYEHEYFSIEPIRFTPDMVTEITIVCGPGFEDRKTWEIKKFIRENIPKEYTSRIKLVKQGSWMRDWANEGQLTTS
jgi:hypothetical protein